MMNGGQSKKPKETETQKNKTQKTKDETKKLFACWMTADTGGEFSE